MRAVGKSSEMGSQECCEEILGPGQGWGMPRRGGQGQAELEGPLGPIYSLWATLMVSKNFLKDVKRGIMPFQRYPVHCLIHSHTHTTHTQYTYTESQIHILALL